METHLNGFTYEKKNNSSKFQNKYLHLELYYLRRAEEGYRAIYMILNFDGSYSSVSGL